MSQCLYQHITIQVNENILPQESPISKPPIKTFNKEGREMIPWEISFFK